ncbi:MAG TPA: hypothetical protein ENK21_07170, partial [Trueperaceae bacterium]|nr:hypothetical protein [Trueperaceae bacterium]
MIKGIKILVLSSILAFSLFVFADNKVGCPNVEYPDWESSEYVLPFAVGKTVKVQLGNCSSSYHSEQYPDKFAYDFVMDIGTEIYASRAGKVVFVEESGRDYRHPNNLVVVDH